jgi:hypothetical protein
MRPLFIFGSYSGGNASPVLPKSAANAAAFQAQQIGASLERDAVKCRGTAPATLESALTVLTHTVPATPIGIPNERSREQDRCEYREHED